MEQNKVTLYELAKNQINKMMRTVIQEDPKLIHEEDIRVQTELQLALKLTDIVKTNETLSDGIEKAIEYTMQVFNKAFHEVYELYLEELQQRGIESTTLTDGKSANTIEQDLQKVNITSKTTKEISQKAEQEDLGEER